jgi:hypothetical protein
VDVLLHHGGGRALAEPGVVTVDSGELCRRYEAVDPRLGRTLHLDARSLAYAVERDAAAMGRTPKTVLWQRVLGILDQGSLGSCTGNAGVGALGTQPFYDAMGRQMPLDVAAAERYAVQLYADATRLDVWPGSYPPEDTGSSGLAVCKVLRSRGVIAGYRWATSPAGLARLLQEGPVLLGMPWYSAFFDPAPGGWIERGDWQRSGVAGGHEVEVVGIDVDAHDFGRSALTLANSWGTGWGERGYFRMRLATYSQLWGCDVKQFVI